MAEKKHKWTHDDDVALEAAINLLLPLMAAGITLTVTVPVDIQPVGSV